MMKNHDIEQVENHKKKIQNPTTSKGRERILIIHFSLKLIIHFKHNEFFFFFFFFKKKDSLPS
jgi:hypothetical protein